MTWVHDGERWFEHRPDRDGPRVTFTESERQNGVAAVQRIVRAAHGDRARWRWAEVE